MARRSSRVFRSGGKTRRLTQWTSTDPETAYIGLAAATALLDSTFVTDANNPETIIRVRGLLSLQSDQDGQDEQAFGAVGLAVVSDQAVAIGVTAIPTPYADAESDFWMMHQFWCSPVNFNSAVGVAMPSDRQYEFDSKAMRKITPDQTLCLVIENGSSAFGVLYRLDLRILSKVA